MDWLRKRVRKWRRARAAKLDVPALPAVTGIVTVAALHPSASQSSPILRTTLRPSLASPCLLDTEIRGFLDGTVKLERNVATQYHVRIGCEGSKPDRGRYEVMRVLERWDLRELPKGARVVAARLVLCQEDLTRFPHRNPPVWPVDFYVHEVRKPWGPGRGGVKHDNQSAPEPGDAWWLDAKAGELRWREPGCGFASDDDRDADCGAQPLAAARLSSPVDDLVFTGSRLAAHIERKAAEGGGLDILIKASSLQEAVSGSIKAFYSAEYGDAIHPAKRPRLEIEWTAPAVWSTEQSFVLEPGASTRIPCDVPDGCPSDAVLRGSVAVDAGAPFAPELTLPRLSAAPHPIPAGEQISIPILETWTPNVTRPEDLEVRFQFTAPSGRVIASRARFTGDFTYTGELQPDEIGIWSYEWRSRPDERFPEHAGHGWFTVVLREDSQALATALRSFAEAALRDATAVNSIAARKQTRRRLTALEAELKALPGTREILDRIAAMLPRVE